MTDKLRIYEDGTDTVIAHSPADAVAVWNETIGEDYVDDGHGQIDSWTPRQGNDLRITDEEGNPIERTHAEWIAQYGRSYLCEEGILR